MKIRTDVEQILQNRPPVTFVKTQQNIINSQPMQTAVARTMDQPVMDRLNMERALNDSLNIAQISQSLLQKAMLVSSRLRSIAVQSIISGRTDDNELRSAMAEIQTSMKQYGEIVSSPQVNATGANRIPQIPQVRGDIDQVLAAAGQFENGTIPEATVITDIQGQLSERLNQTGQAVSRIQGQLRYVMESYPLPGNFNTAVTIPATADLITKNPASALGAQGSIGRETAVRLLGA